MLSPVNLEYRRMLESRSPSLYNLRRFKVNVFLTSTKLVFQDFLRLVLSMESRIELLRQRLSRMIRFNVRAIFERIDRLGKGWIIDSDVILNTNNFYFKK